MERTITDSPSVLRSTNTSGLMNLKPQGECNKWDDVGSSFPGLEQPAARTA